MELSAKKNKILVLGSSGQLGRALQIVTKTCRTADYIFTDRAVCDITKPDQVLKVLDQYQPDVIVNTAAYTAVDLAESNVFKAKQVNTTAVSFMAQQASKRDIGFVHISTDYVFDGQSTVAYTPEYKTNPQSVYGKTKLAGEQAIIDAGIEKYIIIRTSWLYSTYGANFVKTMLRLSSERSEISVVNDQVGSPTWARDLARALCIIIPQLSASNAGIYHFSNSGEVSWYDFAKAIFFAAKKDIYVKPIVTEQFPRPAKRPKRSVLNCTKTSQVFGIPLVPWEKSLNMMIASSKGQ